MSAKATIVFVLDISSSMSDKISTLNMAVSTFINDYPIGHKCGIVLFNGNSWIEHNVIQIVDSVTRNSLSSKVPRNISGCTNIGAGLINGLTAITNAGLQTEGAILFLVTDGEHNCNPQDYVAFALPKLKLAKVRVDCIAYGNEADINLERITRETGGKIYKADDKNKEMALRVIEAGIRETVISNEITESKLITVCDDVITVNNNLVKTVYIDSDIGRNTLFSVQLTDFDKFSVSLASPNNVKYDCNSSEYKNNLVAKIHQFEFKRAETGLWSLSIANQLQRSFNLNFRVTSRSLNANAVKLNAFLNNPDKKEVLPAMIFVELVKGNDNVIQAEVEANIEKPNGTQVSVKLIELNSVYWAYFDDYSDKGRYNVSVIAKSLDSISSVKFQRQEVVGCFKVDQFITWTTDCEVKVQQLIGLKQFKTKK